MYLRREIEFVMIPSESGSHRDTTESHECHVFYHTDLLSDQQNTAVDIKIQHGTAGSNTFCFPGKTR